MIKHEKIYKFDFSKYRKFNEIDFIEIQKKNIKKFDIILQFGNNFENFYSILKKKSFFSIYIDNPSLPHLSYLNPINKNPSKKYYRILNNKVLPTKLAFSESQIKYFTLFTEWFYDSGFGRSVIKLSKNEKCLIIKPDNRICMNYYGISNEEWLRNCKKILNKLNIAYDIRDKPDIKLRRRNADFQLTSIIKNYQFSVSIHSLSAVETLFSGRPAVVYNKNFLNKYAINIHNLKNNGTLICPTEKQLLKLYYSLLSTNFHKNDLKNFDFLNDIQFKYIKKYINILSKFY